jgi:dolichyl-diphosphooligosaccharide--protein glycosyltransferase
MSAVSAVSTASVYGEAGGTEKDWIEATEWLVDGTPETGVDYYKLYDGEGFSYPSEAYGVMSWWDYGHYITTIGERIPNSNPFQAGVAGEYGAAQVLTATDEDAVVEKLDYLGTKYVMTDYQMAGSKFGAMAIWSDTELQTTPFYTYLLQQSSTGSYSVVSAQTEKYYNTLTARLQNFDGSYTEAGSVVLVLTDSSAGYGYPVITYTKSYANADDAWKMANDYNAQSSNTAAGKYAYVISVPTQVTDYFDPNADVSALKHFRIVYESDTYVIPADGYSYYVTEPNGGGTAWVKTFEYVKGAVIKGNGIISIDVTTNNGRTFTYRQVSENGQFVVPYATGQTGEIKTGVYKIEGSGQTFTVSEKAVQNGLSIN